MLKWNYSTIAITETFPIIYGAPLFVLLLYPVETLIP
jgi:hypothetical protein